MKYRNMKARLKKSIEINADIGNLDFNQDWLNASAVIENMKRKMMESIKSEMHKTIAELSIDDIEFKIN